ncbi:uncharacterized protein LOC143450137 [Clavelina lepadiformis]|uniref:uncharacterized protein LOC143450137 n=1 Tax=Clavelina lepadiformis TaxID=159417 RepID=UPI004041487B
MKVFFVSLACLVAVAASYTVNEVELQQVQFSEAAKAQLIAVSKDALQNLCLSENVEPEILTTICMKALSNSFQSVYSSDAMTRDSRNCVDCSVADPICWDACPQ